MAVDPATYQTILARLEGKAKLVAVSKTKPAEDILALYDLGQRDFAENYVQELVAKQPRLPADIRWHFIGHLQTNKVKYIAPFIYMVQSVDSLKLAREIDKEATRQGRVIDCLLQVHIAREETKFGFDERELGDVMQNDSLHALQHIRVRGLMGMATLSADTESLSAEFKGLKTLCDKYFARGNGDPAKPGPPILSMGMSGDYEIALREGSTMVRIGSLLFGPRGSAKML